jgi:hypothetical protein
MNSVVASVADDTNFESVIAAQISSAKVKAEKPAEIKAPTGSGYNSMAGGLAGITINVNGADPQGVVDALRQYQRQNGFVPITVGV